MSAVMGFAMVKGEIRQVPKYGLTLDEVEFAIGTADLVASLRKIGALMPAKRLGRTLIFDAGGVALVWAKFIAGDYDRQLEAIGKL